MTKTLTPYTCLLLIMLMMSCAKMGQPDGGWFDETPPAIVGSTPGDKATNVKTRKVSILFDEFIQVDNPTEKVVSARNHEHDKVEALDYGADDYLVKPFGTSELLARIRTAIRHTRTTLSNTQIAQSGKFVTGDLTIDYDKHQVLMNGQNAGLTVNEYKIVTLLGKYAGKVLTYDFIIRELWGPKAKTDNQILRVNMANIRRKIEPTLKSTTP